MSPEGLPEGCINFRGGDNPSYHTLARLIVVLLHRISYTVPQVFGLVQI